MLRNKKSSGETRFELVIIGATLLTAAVLYVVLPPGLHSLMLFFPGLIVLGGAIYQDMQEEWKAGWLVYVIAILMVASGLAGLVNTLLGEKIKLNWLVVAAVELGVIMIVKALYDPNPNRE